MRKSINAISSQINSDSPEPILTKKFNNASFIVDVEANTRKAWSQKAQDAIRVAKAEASEIVARYEQAVNVRQKQELETIYSTLLADLEPLNSALEKYMTDYMLLMKEAQTRVEEWGTACDANGIAVAGAGRELSEEVKKIEQSEKEASKVFVQVMGRNKKPRKTDDTVVPSDTE